MSEKGWIGPWALCAGRIMERNDDGTTTIREVRTWMRPAVGGLEFGPEVPSDVPVRRLPKR